MFHLCNYPEAKLKNLFETVWNVSWCLPSISAQFQMINYFPNIHFIIFPKRQAKNNGTHLKKQPSQVTESTSTIHFTKHFKEQFTPIYLDPCFGAACNLPFLPPNRLSQEHDSSTTGTTPRLLWLIRTQAGRSADNWSLAVFQTKPGVSLFQDVPGS